MYRLKKDAAVLRTLEGGFGKANQLEAESVKRKVDIRKLNRRLVSNLMEWVDNSMTGLGGNNHLDDLPLDAMLLEQAAPHEISTSCSPESKPTGVQAEPKEATQGDCSLS